jgi:hypothetical protein
MATGKNCMSFKYGRISALTALVLMVAVVQVYSGLIFAAPAADGAMAPEPQQLISGVLRTSANKPITVNGASTASGATVLTGATIETPAGVSATVDLGDAGIVEIQPGSKIQLDFDANGNVRVKLLNGCVIVSRKAHFLPDGISEIYTDHSSEKTDPNKQQIGFCVLPNGTLTPLSGGGTGGGGISGGAVVGILLGVGGGVGLALALRGNDSALRGNNSSPVSP